MENLMRKSTIVRSVSRIRKGQSVDSKKRRQSIVSAKSVSAVTDVVSTFDFEESEEEIDESTERLVDPFDQEIDSKKKKQPTKIDLKKHYVPDPYRAERFGKIPVEIENIETTPIDENFPHEYIADWSVDSVFKYTDGKLFDNTLQNVSADISDISDEAGLKRTTEVESKPTKDKWKQKVSEETRKFINKSRVPFPKRCRIEEQGMEIYKYWKKALRNASEEKRLNEILDNFNIYGFCEKAEKERKGKPVKRNRFKEDAKVRDWLISGKICKSKKTEIDLRRPLAYDVFLGMDHARVEEKKALATTVLHDSVSIGEFSDTESNTNLPRVRYEEICRNVGADIKRYSIGRDTNFPAKNKQLSIDDNNLGDRYKSIEDCKYRFKVLTAASLTDIYSDGVGLAGVNLSCPSLTEVTKKKVYRYSEVLEKMDRLVNDEVERWSPSFLKQAKVQACRQDFNFTDSDLQYDGIFIDDVQPDLDDAYLLPGQADDDTASSSSKSFPDLNEEGDDDDDDDSDGPFSVALDDEWKPNWNGAPWEDSHSFIASDYLYYTPTKYYGINEADLILEDIEEAHEIEHEVEAMSIYQQLNLLENIPMRQTQKGIFRDAFVTHCMEKGPGICPCPAEYFPPPNSSPASMIPLPCKQPSPSIIFDNVPLQINIRSSIALQKGYLSYGKSCKLRSKSSEKSRRNIFKSLTSLISRKRCNK